MIAAGGGTAHAAPKKQKTTKTTKTTKATKATRTTGDVRKEQQRNEKEIAETRKKLTDNERRTRDQLDRLNSINSQIERQRSTIAELNTIITGLQDKHDALRDSINLLHHTDSILSAQVARELRTASIDRQRITPLAFILSSASFRQAQQRLHYIRQVERRRNNTIDRLRNLRNLLSGKQMELDTVINARQHALQQLATANSVLDTRRRESDKVITDLRKDAASLNKVLAEKRKRAQQLDNELNRIIAAEHKKQEQAPAKPSGQSKPSGKTKPTGEAAPDRQLSGSFASNKGKLLFPVPGKYTIVGSFGRSQHDNLNHVQVDNSGVDISVTAGTKARAVFNGTVSSIFFMDGYENIVIIRHGEYLTVYAGLANINVSKGDKVSAGTTLGTIATADGRTVLHFEVRKERTKLNPMEWIK